MTNIHICICKSKEGKLVKKQTRKQPQIINYLVLGCIEKKYKNDCKGIKIISKH